jgi:LPXTG-motif cell wall-anchored protein
MSRVVRFSLIATVIVLVGVGTAMAQTMTHEVRQGTVLHAYGDNVVVKMDDGTVREFDVQPGFMFDIDGKPTPASQLKPGTVLTANITTTTEPHVVKTEEIRRGKVVNRVGQTLIVRTENGEIRKFEGVPSDMTFTVDGEVKNVYDLRPGMNLTAHIVHEQVDTVTEREVQVAGTAPAAPKPAPRPAAASAAPAAAPAMLPSTGSQLPLVGLAGLALIALAAGIGILRRF